MAEYLIIVVIIAICVIVGIRYFGGTVQNQFTDATGQLDELEKEKAGAPGSSNPSGTYQIERRADQGTDGLSTSGGEKRKGSSLHSAGVGEDRGNVISEIEIDWQTLFLIGGIVVAGGVVVVMRISKRDKDKKKKKKKKKKIFGGFTLGKKGQGEDGQAMAEFVIIAITFLFVILGIIQMAMILNAYALTRYAAYNAARAAIVHGGDQAKMEEAARLSLLSIFPRHGRADHMRGLTENYLAARATDSNPLFHTYFFTFNGLPVPVFEKITDVKILEREGRNAGDIVTFDDPRDSEKALVTVQVTHRYEMVIPLVNRILFYVYNLFRVKKTTGFFGGYSGESLNNLSAETDARRRDGSTYASVEYRLPLIAHYTMRMQSDLVVP
ncbi:MAG: pilus assembly protein [Deltaproteobacteria bacterium]|nr:pilus assembly protein [Deltaproteobacteria bacterium]